jgi:hypothetical protein
MVQRETRDVSLSGPVAWSTMPRLSRRERLAKSLESRGSFDSPKRKPAKENALIAIRCQQPDFFNFILQSTVHLNHNPQRSPLQLE